VSSSTPESNNTHQEVVAIREKLQHIQSTNLKNVWEQIKELNEQNALLIQEVTLLRKSMSEQVANGVVKASIFLAFLSFVLAFFIAILLEL
jgi:hypothetical protein